MEREIKVRQHWVFCIGAVVVWLAMGWPAVRMFIDGQTVRGVAVTESWIIAYLLFGAAVLGAMAPMRRTSLFWLCLCIQVAATAAMANLISWAGMAMFLTIIAWQVTMGTTAERALGWVAVQTLVVVAALSKGLNPDLCWVVAKSFAMQLLVVFTANTLKREAETARALAQANRELRAAQAIIANNVRSAERMRISRELHDAWGHELTALGLQLEIASHVTESERASRHVTHAKQLARELLAKVRDVVASLREAERGDLKETLAGLARNVPRPAVHVEVAPGIQVGPDQTHALVRCAQEAVTNAIKHGNAENLWLQVTPDGDGVRLVARNDGEGRSSASSPGSGLLGMRERVEALGGRLAVQAGPSAGFKIEAWMPARPPQTA